MRYLLSLFCLLPLSLVYAQSPFIPLNQDYYHLIDRYEIRLGRWADQHHSTVKPYNRQAVMQLVDTLENDPDQEISLSPTDRFNINYLRDDSWEWASPQPVKAQFPRVSVAFGQSTDSSATQPVVLRYEEPGNSERPLLGFFYRKKSDFYSVKNKEYDLHINPVVYVGYGRDQVLTDPLYTNTRGIEVRGSIGGKLGFYSYFADNQAYYPKYVQDYGQSYRLTAAGGGSSPGQGVVKLFNNNAADFLEARGYITFNTLKIINVQFGHDRNFFGNGIRSLLLSDNAAPYLFLKLSTRFGKRFQYTNLFTELQNGQVTLSGIELLPQKFTTMHHLSVNISRRVNLGLFEAEVYSRDRFDINYLNPIILYRYVEASRGSADNAFVGLDLKVNAAQHLLFYSQLMLDEFLIKEIRAARGSWTNKIAVQAGLKYIDVLGVPNLDLQGEFNMARPYTYAHKSGQTNYAHFNQPMASPLGANFMEGLGTLRYQNKRLSVNGTFSLMMYGTDPPGRNYGGNVLKDYEERLRDYDNFIGQGRKTITTYTDLRLTYMLKHNLFLEGRYLNRMQDSQYIPDTYKTSIVNVAIRWNAPYRSWVF
ncbi:hypothetical protein FAES_5453 [Fibrella aestuarina BUZ 2]|uniref:Capsule assembly Wzi family protein n=1 Tax=Fibrella aestuarina BUZ 2 TaxID=1166018 RepID=I0KH49_9BACT|nr:hypothetical protein [Fibrella aestuarina]CCH03452.1 hypothetical protein FAES_5453 [Fibrella aestuarina BUZ 2]